MKKFTLLVITASVFVSLTAQAADNDRKPVKNRRERAERREAKVDIDKLIREINQLDNSPAAMRAGMAAVSKETAVPLPTIEAEHKEHPKVGLAGLFMAHELSTHTQQPVEKFLKQHAAGKTWTEVATANNEDLNAIEAKLARIQAAMKNPKAAISTPNDRTPVRERAEQRETKSARSDIDKQADAINALGSQPLAMRAGLTALSKETAVPLPTVEENQKQHSKIGLGDFAVAQELSTRAHRPVNELMKMHNGGKSWAEIAAAHNQDTAVIQKKLSNIEQSMRDAK